MRARTDSSSREIRCVLLSLARARMLAQARRGLPVSTSGKAQRHLLFEDHLHDGKVALRLRQLVKPGCGQLHLLVLEQVGDKPSPRIGSSASASGGRGSNIRDF